MSSGGGPWTPNLLQPIHWTHAPIVGDLGRLTLSGLNVEAIADEAGGAYSISKISDPRRPLLVNSDVLDGHTSIEFDRTNDSALRSTTGGVTGNAVHSMLLFCQWTAAANTTGLQAEGLMQFGPAGGYLSSNIGQYYETGVPGSSRLWGGGSGVAGPFGTAAISPSDTNYHLREKYYDGTKGYLLQDGVLAGPFGFAEFATAGYGIGDTAPTPAEFGYQKIVAGYPIPSTRLQDGLFFDRVISGSERLNFYRWLASEYPSIFTFGESLLFVGDSIAAGAGVLAADRYSKLVSTALGMTERNTAIGGQTTTDIQTHITASLLQSGIAQPKAFIYEGGINDLAASVSAATIFARDLQIFATVRAMYPTIKICSVTCTPDNGFDAPKNAQKLALNNLRLGGTNTADCVADLNTTSLGTWNGTDYYDGVHYYEVGHAKAATVIQTALASVGIT